MNKFIPFICFIGLAFNTYGQEDSIKLESKKKVVFHFNMGIMTQLSADNDPLYGITSNQVVLYKFGRLLQLGVGTGFDDYSNFRGIPITIQYYGDVLKSKNTPFYFAAAGYANMWGRPNDNYEAVKGGKVITLGAGYSWRIDKVNINISLAYKRQEFKTLDTPNYYYYFDVYSGGNSQSTYWTLNRTEFKVGIGF